MDGAARNACRVEKPAFLMPQRPSNSQGVTQPWRIERCISSAVQSHQRRGRVYIRLPTSRQAVHSSSASQHTYKVWSGCGGCTAAFFIGGGSVEADLSLHLGSGFRSDASCTRRPPCICPPTCFIVEAVTVDVRGALARLGVPHAQAAVAVTAG